MTESQKERIFSATRKDFRVDYFRCGGPGGQNVNKVNSGVRITHIPSGLSVRSCETRDQGKNKKLAFRRLAKLLVTWAVDQERERSKQTISSEVVRTYNEPDNRVKDNASGLMDSYRGVLNDIEPMIVARQKAQRGHR